MILIETKSVCKVLNFTLIYHKKKSRKWRLACKVLKKQVCSHFVSSMFQFIDNTNVPRIFFWVSVFFDLKIWLENISGDFYETRWLPVRQILLLIKNNQDSMVCYRSESVYQVPVLVFRNIFEQSVVASFSVPLLVCIIQYRRSWPL